MLYSCMFFAFVRFGLLFRFSPIKYSIEGGLYCLNSRTYVHVHTATMHTIFGAYKQKFSDVYQVFHLFMKSSFVFVFFLYSLVQYTVYSITHETFGKI